PPVAPGVVGHREARLGGQGRRPPGGELRAELPRAALPHPGRRVRLHGGPARPGLAAGRRPGAVPRSGHPPRGRRQGDELTRLGPVSPADPRPPAPDSPSGDGVKHLCHVFPGFGAGGPEVRTALLIDAAGDEFRHTVVSLSGELGGRERVGRRDGVAFVAAPRPGGRAASPWALARLLRGLRPDLVLTYGWGGTDAV